MNTRDNKGLCQGSKDIIVLLVYLPVKTTGSNIVVFCMLTLYFR